MKSSLTFQELILRLQKFWAERGCVLQQPYDVEVGAGTMAPETFLRVLGPKPYKVAYVQPSRRPADGRYGEPRPTDPQLRAGARVVALWTLLYPIPVDFAHTIIPHRQIASKACPGSNFPYDEFQRLVKFYRDGWDASVEAKARIAAFKLKPYLFV